jgi:AcrR family transcriptional regulator
VLADVGISKTAFYKHFACKEDLVLAALEMKNCWLQDTFREMVRARGGATPAGQLRALLDVVDRIIDADEYQGCMFVNVAMEFLLPHDPAHVAAARHKRAIQDIVRDLAARAGAAVWAPQEVALLGALPDAEVAAKTGRSVPAVNKKRLALGRPALSADGAPYARRFWTPAEDEAARALPADEAARVTGRTVQAVRRRRAVLGAAPPR